MSFEKRNPLPPGRYWIDVADRPPGQVVEFRSFLEDSRVDVESEEETPADGPTPAQCFFLFKTDKPLAFASDRFGFPTIAKTSDHSKSDTGQVPDPVKDANEMLSTGIALLEGLAIVFTLKTVFDFLSKFRKAP